jgi:hypothetical protein
VGDVMDAAESREWHRAFAVECNNGAFDLLAKADRTPAESDLMVDMAHAARYHWGVVGTELNVARADYLVSRVHAFLGHAEPALQHASAALQRAEALGLSDFDLAYAHEAMARAHACAGEVGEAQRELAVVSSIPIEDPEDKAIFEADLASEPWYGAR